MRVDVGVLAIVLAVVLPVIVVVLAVRAVRDAPRRAPLPVDPGDAAELDRIARELAREHHRAVAASLWVLLDTLHKRGVPLREVRPVPGIRGQGVLVFADGSAILARSPRPGDLGTVAVASLQERVLLTAAADTGSEFAIQLSWGADARQLAAVAVADGPVGDGPFSG